MSIEETPSIPFTSQHPGCVLLLVDQSGSMSEPDLGSQLSTTSRAQGVAEIVNRLIWDLVLANTKGTRIIDRVHIGLITYGHGGARTVPSLPGLENLTHVASSPLTEDVQITPQYDGFGGFVDVESSQPTWLEPIAYGKTPMCEAFRLAHRLLEPWVQKHCGSSPPIVFNVSDGIATDGDPIEPMKALRALRTESGCTLVFNILLTGVEGGRVAWPAEASRVYAVPLQSLVEGASVLPREMRVRAEVAYGTELEEGARGVVINGGLSDLAKLLDIGTPVNHA